MRFILIVSALVFSYPAHALDLLNTLKKTVEESVTTSTTSSTSQNNLSTNQIINGLQEALKVGTKQVISQVGQTDGYFKDQNIHIPVPQELSLLSKLGFSSLLDDLDLKINRAAEQAAPEVQSIIINAISSLTFDDAVKIYEGENDAATQFFKRTTTQDLSKLIEPIVKQNLDEVQALTIYDSLISQYKTVPFVPDLKTNITDHTTALAIDGIFYYLAQEEKAIRENPAKRTTDILKSVFGS